jgi:O-methyltransferase
VVKGQHHGIIKFWFGMAMLSEPWFEVELRPLTASETWGKEDEIIWNQKKRHSDKHYFFQTAFEFISDNEINGDYHEFGCHRCRTFRMAMLEASRHFLDDMKFYAYDSFCGLPESDESHTLGSRWRKGALSTSADEFLKLINSSGFETERVELFKGFYDDSLKNIDTKKKFDKKAALINIDCDLYESSIPVFEYISTLCQEGTVLYIDDYFTGYKGNPKKGVSLAFLDWLKGSSWEAEPYREVGWAGRSFILYR